MNRRAARCRAWAGLLILLVYATPSSHAGGPLTIGGPSFGIEGQAFVWDNSKPIQYRTDGGPLGAVSNSSANNLVAQAFQQWRQVPTAKLSVSRVGSISGVADGNVNTMAELDAAMASCNAGTQTPIIYDDNGVLLQQLTGDDGVLGISGPCALSPSGKVQSAFSLLGNPSSLPANGVSAVMTHELGHLLGLGHTDIRVPLTTGTTQSDIDGIPTMYWELLTPLQSTLEADDKAWISKLYPSSSFASQYGVITDDVYFSDGKYPAQDVLVIARSVSDIHRTVVSSISGYRFTGNPGQPYTADYLPCIPSTACVGGTLGANPGSQFGSRDASLVGSYEIPVPPGQYTLEVQEISGGAIGPIRPFLPLPGTGATLPGVVTVQPGQTLSDVNIVLQGTDPPFDIFEQPQANISVSPRDGSPVILQALLYSAQYGSRRYADGQP
jgi:hypothetical protein